jgi:hypothetical protein
MTTNRTIRKSIHWLASAALSMALVSCNDDDSSGTSGTGTTTTAPPSTTAFVGSTVTFNPTITFVDEGSFTSPDIEDGDYRYDPQAKELTLYPGGPAESGLYENIIVLELPEFTTSGGKVTSFRYNVKYGATFGNSTAGTATVVVNGGNLAIPDSGGGSGTTLAPASIEGKSLDLTILTSTDGAPTGETDTFIALPNGVWVQGGDAEDVDNGSYTYEVTGANTARIKYNFSDEDETGEGVIDLSFTSSIGGTYQLTESGLQGTAPYSYTETGTFVLSN